MRILVYGAGVQGCELAHRLLQNKKNVVTMLARGEWKERLDQRGLVIRHWAQCRTTVDRVATIDTLAPDDCYDLVFVTMQAGQLPDVLPILKQNRSEYFVFVGNDPHAVEVMQAMQRPADKIAFGFQSSGGHRDVDKVVSAHVGVGMTIGGATAPLSGVFRYRVKTAFEGAKYKLTFVSDMDGWLKCHLALILPACYLCYACSGDLSKATKEQRDETARLSKKIIAGTVLFGLAAGFMETFGSDPGMASTPTVLASLLLLVLFCIASLQLLGVSLGKAGDPAGKTGGAVDGPLDGVYRLAVLVMMAGFLFVPVLGSFGVPGEAIVLAGYLGLTFVLVSLFLVMAKITGQDAAVSFARGFAALYAGELAGIACGNGIELLEPAGQVPYAVAAFAGLAALYAYLFLFTERDFRALSVIVRDADRFDDACRLIASEHGLSKREAEILPLALKGRTGERIAAEFFISKSTVDTHLRRIYVKTGTHGRQELIDLGERTSQDLARRG